MRYIIGLLLFLLTLTTSAQIGSHLKSLKEQRENTEQSLRKISFPIIVKKPHRLYLNKDWQNSCVLTEAGEYLYFNGRFNVLSQAVEAKLNGQVRAVRPAEIKIVSIGSQYFVPIEINKKWEFFEILSEGEMSLLKIYKLTGKMEGGNSLLQEYTGEKEYVIEPELIYTADFKFFKKLKTNKKKILLLFRNKKNNIADYIAENKIKYREERSLVRLFNYYNSLFN